MLLHWKMERVVVKPVNPSVTSPILSTIIPPALTEVGLLKLIDELGIKVIKHLILHVRTNHMHYIAK